jgi:signal transduction histidine kinase
VSPRWGPLWLAVDLGLISGAVFLTGGINSEAALVYFWPIATSSIRRLPRRTLAVTVATALLYALATWSTRDDPKYPSALIFRLLLLLVVGGLATSYAMAEQSLIDEVARLREEVALADYRDRLSREMHDGIQHYLADITMRLELARRLAATDPAAAARLACDQRFVVRQAAGELRYLVRLLRSPEVEREGLVGALRHHLVQVAEASGLSAPLAVEGEAGLLSREVAQAAFRIAQEAITNAEKHAAATEVRVTLRFAPERFTCTITDNGVGFDLAAAQPSPGRGFGLPSMRQRAESVGGSLDITSAPGQGTTVTFAVATQEA